MHPDTDGTLMTRILAMVALRATDPPDWPRIAAASMHPR
jgi:hypothetical protein